MDLEQELDRLYAIPLEEFTASRDEITKQLKASGQAAESERVSSLRKPTVTAWVVNQLARTSRATLSDLISLRDAVEGANSLKESRSAVARRRTLIAELLREADAVMKSAGKKLSGENTQRVSNTLLAASTGIDSSAVRSGRLERDLIPAGFATSAMELSESTAESQERTTELAKAERLQQAAQEAEAQAQRRESQAARAESEARRTQELAAHQRETAEKARARADEARARAENALSKLD